MKGAGMKTVFPGRGDLIVHQGDQRRNDQDQADSAGGGQLITQALAAAGGQDHQGIASGKHGIDGLPLQGPEPGKSPMMKQRGFGGEGPWLVHVLTVPQFCDAG